MALIKLEPAARKRIEDTLEDLLELQAQLDEGFAADIVTQAQVDANRQLVHRAEATLKLFG